MSGEGAMIVRKRGDWLAARVGDEILMMSAEEGLYMGLSPMGARIWDLIDAPLAAEEICARLEQEFDVAPDLCRAEVRAFLDDLVLHRAIDLEAAAEA
jgi:hypothetical protein